MGPGGFGARAAKACMIPLDRVTASGRLASDFSTFPHIICIPSLGVKVQSDAHYSSKR